jgi:sulfur-oxidizing protein SoxX
VKKQSIRMFAIVFCSLYSLLSSAAPPANPEAEIKEGQRLTLQFCQTCHAYQGTEQAGTVGPPLMGMKARFPDRKKLYEIIYDPQVALKPDTMMPPFGRNHLMEKDDIEKVIEFLYTL